MEDTQCNNHSKGAEDQHRHEDTLLHPSLITTTRPLCSMALCKVVMA